MKEREGEEGDKRIRERERLAHVIRGAEALGERNRMRRFVYVCQQFIKSNNAVGTATVYLTHIHA